MFPIAGACAKFSYRSEIRKVALLPIFYSLAQLKHVLQSQEMDVGYLGKVGWEISHYGDMGIGNSSGYWGKYDVQE